MNARCTHCSRTVRAPPPPPVLVRRCSFVVATSYLYYVRCSVPAFWMPFGCCQNLQLPVPTCCTRPRLFAQRLPHCSRVFPVARTFYRGGTMYGIAWCRYGTCSACPTCSCSFVRRVLPTGTGRHARCMYCSCICLFRCAAGNALFLPSTSCSTHHDHVPCMVVARPGTGAGHRALHQRATHEHRAHHLLFQCTRPRPLHGRPTTNTL